MSYEILTLVEHRRGEIRDITFEMLGLADGLARQGNGTVTAVLLGHGVEGLADRLTAFADHVVMVDNPSLEQFSPEAYRIALSGIVRERQPRVVLIGHTSYGMDVAPGLATELELPLITDVTELKVEEGATVAVRPVYAGKAKARVRARGNAAVVTVESGAFAAAGGGRRGEIDRPSGIQPSDSGLRRFVDFVEAPPADVDITQSDIVVSVGRGIGDPENIPVVEKLASVLGGVLACSRPVVDKKWLPKARQVGISGKSVSPRLYLAVGISGAFQHLAGIKKAQTVVAINKDPNAPIFRVADYGVVGDLFAVVPKLTERIGELKRGG
ncbi:MAG TPA: electron transfer flavoprotein subunit alpha/FixB family protein [Chloroflexota bacterium]